MWLLILVFTVGFMVGFIAMYRCVRKEARDGLVTFGAEIYETTRIKIGRQKND